MTARRSYLLILFILAMLPAAAQSPVKPFMNRLHPGIEWGYSQHLYGVHTYNIVNSEGNRMNGGYSGFNPHPDAMFLVTLGYEAGKRVTATLITGYEGVSTDTRLIPLRLRLSLYGKGVEARNTFFTFAEGGAGFRMPSMMNGKTAFTAALGEGFRLGLMPGVSMDLMLRFQLTFDTPHIPDPDGSGYVQERNIRRNEARYYALGIVVGISF